MTFLFYSRESLKRARKEHFRVLSRQAFLVQRAFRPVPLIDPVDHAKQRKCRRAWSYTASRRPFALHFRDQVLHKMNIVFLARVDATSHRRRQWMIFMKHYGDLPVAHAHHYLDVTADE